jgi:hypothetical protein
MVYLHIIWYIYLTNAVMDLPPVTSAVILIVESFKIKVKNTLFNLGMVTYSYERQDLIQFALKRLPGG